MHFYHVVSSNNERFQLSSGNSGQLIKPMHFLSQFVSFDLLIAEEYLEESRFLPFRGALDIAHENAHQPDGEFDTEIMVQRDFG